MATLTFLFPPSASLHRPPHPNNSSLNLHITSFTFRTIKVFSSPSFPLFLTQDDLKKLVVDKDVKYVSSGMVLGLGTCSTTAFVVDERGELLKTDQLKDIVGIPISKRTQEQAASLGIPLSILYDHLKLDLAIDSADEVDPDLNLVKGCSGVLFREKIMKAALDKFVVVEVDPDPNLVFGSTTICPN